MGQVSGQAITLGSLEPQARMSELAATLMMIG